MKKSENGRSILEIIFVLFIITLILLAGFYLWDQQKAEVKAHAVTERLVTIKNNRRLSMQAHSEERMPRKEKGPHNTEFSVENGIDQQNSDWFWVTIKTEDTSLCAFLNEANVGADKIDDFCEKEGTTTFYFKKNPQKTTANTPEKNFQPQSCPANSICDKDLNTIGCEENYFLYNFNCLACPENSIECTDNNFECSEGYYKKDNTCQPCDGSIPECNPEENNTSSGSGSSGSSSSSSSSDPCKDINCGRHGTCKKGVCICSDNYYGEHCEISPWVCKNGGKWNTTTYECECINGYTGVTCDVLNPCFNVNCGTHGTCSDGACICTDNYYGENCENAPLACQNGGSWNTTTHQCDCPNGYSGNTCGIKDPCLDVNCGAHGTCSGGSCVCTDDYYGDRCQTAPLTCQNGGTWNTTTHVCDCATGFTGDTCGTKLTTNTCTDKECCTQLKADWKCDWDEKTCICVGSNETGICSGYGCVKCLSNETPMLPTSMGTEGICIKTNSNESGACGPTNCLKCTNGKTAVCSKYGTTCFCADSSIGETWDCHDFDCIKCSADQGKATCDKLKETCSCTPDPCADFEPTVCRTACTNNNGTAVYTYAEEGTSCGDIEHACDGEGNCNECLGGSLSLEYILNNDNYVKGDLANSKGCYCFGNPVNFTSPTMWNGYFCTYSGGAP